MFKNLFSKKEPKKYGPVEPIYPDELFEVSEISDENGFFGFSNINKAYDNYPNKKYFPWWVQVTLELQEVDDRKMPLQAESILLDELEDSIEKFILKKHKTHFIGRVTQNGFRDLIFYIDLPRFNQEETSTFFDAIQEKRRVNFNMEKDLTWDNVSGLIQ
ncbi:DUF695 domain-containing protein [Flavobacteriaceae bacterium 3-367]|uniref:DUF695 domain-containing protein n=1 Tax=Eudoraea algarum TaxID=3417568 RepID=UPI003295A781